VYDQTYGSLRLSSKLLAEGVLVRALEMAAQLAGHAVDHDTSPDSVLPDVQQVLIQLAREAADPAVTPAWTETAPPPPESGERVRVILGDSQGICVLHGNREMKIQQVYYSPRSGLQYKGRLSSDNSWETHLTVVPVEGVLPVPGLSVMGWYDLDLGELIPDEPESDS
jgi:DEAD/DEAH box helicase domain-containing protein